ncbi:hypothetical protein [Sphingomonas sp.]|jgi:hypothetical protein|uniref:hypothetical protein n=1 Tax=Sphingomonas sp. TaxID=28214 RepID=UPI002619D23F|nr:hypothetical protein [Sphingomonas sp.]MDF2605146.1 hypothetical protein [Sphingomonas sp.]
MDIEEELLDFLENLPRKVGQPRRDGTPRKMAEPDPALQSRNQQIILSYYGFGGDDEFWPTYEDLGRKHDQLTRERIRQLIQRNYLDQLDEPLPVAVKVAEVLAGREFWTEQEFLDEIEHGGLAGRFETVIGLVRYLQSQDLAAGYTVCLPTLAEATRSTYFEHEERVIVSKAKLKSLGKDLQVALKLPGQVGLGNIRYAKRPRGTVDVEALKTLIRMDANAWSGVEGDQFWYAFEERADNSLVNAAEKAFAIADAIPLDALAEMLHHALYRRTATTEFPGEALIRTWITQSRHFAVEDGLVSFRGTPTELVDGERALVTIMRGKGPMPTADVTKALVAKGIGSATAAKLAFNSPLLFVDRSSGRGNFRVTLATDLGAVKTRQVVPSRYDRLKKRLADLGKTDRASTGAARREQSILAEWIFGGSMHGECAICQRGYSRGALVVAHKKKRSLCAESERLDPYIVFPLCIFGCDFLYEHRFLTIKDGKVAKGREALSETEKRAASALLGKTLKTPWSSGPAAYFANE